MHINFSIQTNSEGEIFKDQGPGIREDRVMWDCYPLKPPRHMFVRLRDLRRTHRCLPRTTHVELVPGENIPPTSFASLWSTSKLLSYPGKLMLNKRQEPHPVRHDPMSLHPRLLIRWNWAMIAYANPIEDKIPTRA
ncbi:jg10466 [Pararge aegeria aegeria]|uniref:Jg10466 protein n=1 Tax=Pararge aegeria aegeria TaxID=348720 RepID=A0A8S4RGF1_9NEOP|nr:jg10466 [Pararge aegeria aegeria]